MATLAAFLADVVAGAFQLAPTDEHDLDEAVRVNTRHADQSLGVNDCLNVVLAARHATVQIFTLDERHFRVVRPLAHGGSFQVLPSDLPPG